MRISFLWDIFVFRFVDYLLNLIWSENLAFHENIFAKILGVEAVWWIFAHILHFLKFRIVSRNFRIFSRKFSFLLLTLAVLWCMEEILIKTYKTKSLCFAIVKWQYECALYYCKFVPCRKFLQRQFVLATLGWENNMLCRIGPPCYKIF